MRKCDSCGKEEFMRKPRRWDICPSCDMKQRYDAGKTVPPKQIKKVSYVSFCEHCGRAYEPGAQTCTWENRQLLS
jgi:NMD protein affecting ribosome stability and mRNA decay